jgi:hypothetical protein
VESLDFPRPMGVRKAEAAAALDAKLTGLVEQLRQVQQDEPGNEHESTTEAPTEPAPELTFVTSHRDIGSGQYLSRGLMRSSARVVAAIKAAL